MRYWIFALLAMGGLMVGCGKENKPPPKDVETETPDLDINAGDLMPPSDLGSPSGDKKDTEQTPDSADKTP